MKQVIQTYRDGQTSVDDVPAPTVLPGAVLVRNRCSLISAGTERATVEISRKSLAGKARSRPDLVAKVVDKARKDGVVETVKMVKSRLNAPVALGYSCAGDVIEVGEGVEGFRVGDRVACAGQNYASHAEFVSVPQNLCAPMPKTATYEQAAYVTLGAIAMQGVRQSEAVLGEIFVVVGLGLLGQLTVQLLKAAGCTVIGSDPDTARQALAENLGTDHVVGPSALADLVAEATDGYGADAVIVTASTKSDAPMQQAAEISRSKGRVVVVGAVGMNLPREPFYVRELDIRMSMSYGPGRYDPHYEEKGHDYPYAYVRWTEQRNMAAFLQMIGRGAVNVDLLTSHRFDIADAGEAYDLIAKPEADSLGVLLSYADQSTPPVSKKVYRKQSPAADGVRVGLIGVGNHVMDRLLPPLSKLAPVSIHAVCNATGKTADRVAKHTGAGFATTNYRELVQNPDINAVLIGTRHDLHAEMVIAGLAAGKHVFVEKPLCLDDVELAAIAEVYQAADGRCRLFVGYNRRYSPHLEAARAAVRDVHTPLTMSFRVNAGALPPDHWLADVDIGGGRIIGEGCHFVDFLQALCDAPLKSVSATAPGNTAGGRNEAILTLGFGDGSVGTVIYAAGGDSRLPKERCEVFGGRTSIVIEDFRETLIYQGGKKKRFKTRGQDKGFDSEMRAFAQAVTDSDATSPRFQDLYAVSQATFRAVDSARTGNRYDLSSSPINE